METYDFLEQWEVTTRPNRPAHRSANTKKFCETMKDRKLFY